MDSNIFGLIISYAYLLAILVTAKLLMNFKPLSPEFIRKFIHISASNWWFILTYFLDALWAKMLGPIFFIIVNGIATFCDLAKYFGMNDKERNYGLIYFPVTLLILVLMVHYGYIPEYISGMGVLIMGYGDGLAALFGKRYGVSQIHPIAGKKTYVGSFTMFIVSFIVIFMFQHFYELAWTDSLRGVCAMLFASAAATIFEVLTPLGFDNITVPIGSALLLNKLQQFI